MNNFFINRPVSSLLSPQISPNHNIYSQLLSPLDKVNLFDNIMAENKELKRILSTLLRERLQISEPLISHSHEKNAQPYIPRLNKTSFEQKAQPIIPVPKDSEIVCKNEEGSPYQLQPVTPPTQKTSTSISPQQEEDLINSTLMNAFPPVEDKDEEERNKPKQILRRSIFKLSTADMKKKQNQKAYSKIKRSKAKHLWISYGRKIINYALDHTQGKIQDKIREYDQKLTSKKAYSEIFLIKESDSQEEVSFKKAFREIALEFIEQEAEKAFSNSSYCHELLSQKDKVARWILCLTLGRDLSKKSD